MAPRSRTALILLVTALVLVPVAAIATDRFDDVSDDNVFHDDIAWLADADVTRGCNPPDNTEFCPQDEVTRGQMAAFLRRLAENRVVDAARLDGLAVADLAPRVAFEADNDLPDESTTLETTIEVPGEGTLVVNAAAYVGSSGVADVVQCAILVDGEIVDGTLMAVTVGGTSGEQNCSTTGAAGVSAGTYTVALDVRGVGADTVLGPGNINVTWVPDGSTD